MGAFFNIAYTKYQTEKQGLLPCPFCGAEAHYANWVGGGGVYCTNCGAKILRDHGKGEEGLTYGADIAAEAWNKRSDE